MTATEMEDVLKNLNHRLTNVEQILPTLATKEDLRAFATREDLKAFATKEELREGLADVRREMKELSSEAKRHAVMLFEQTQEQLEIIATHVADISQRLPPRQ
jgi:uncharacterized protein YukE